MSQILYRVSLATNRLKPGDIPAEVRVKAINALVDNHFRKERVVQGGYPMEMRYAGPREALLHAVFRQNFGCSHLIVGRDHAGVGDFYGPFDAQKIFHEIPAGALELKPLPLDWAFWCYKCGSMASIARNSATSFFKASISTFSWAMTLFCSAMILSRASAIAREENRLRAMRQVFGQTQGFYGGYSSLG